MRHRSRGWTASPRLLGSTTVAFSLVASFAVVIPDTTPAPVLSPAVVAFEATIATTVQTIPPTSLAPSSTTRPTLGSSEPASFEDEILALAERPIRAEAGLGAEVEYVATTIATEVLEEAMETVELSVLALDAVGTSGRAEASEQAVVVLPVPDDPFECHQRASELRLTNEKGEYDRNLVAQMVHTVFECVASVGGLDDVAPTSSGWDAAAWGFEDMSRQVAAEAVVVAYCESIAFAPSSLSGDNPWGYGGVFQMGDREMRMFGFVGASKFDPVDNTYSAATYFMSAMRRGAGWGGWGPWAVVNTGYDDDVNDKVKVPVLPRFTSTDPDYRGRRGVELPEWAVDPWSWEVPSFQGCPTTGHPWPEAQPLA